MLHYSCPRCGWSGETLATTEWRCPQCGDTVGATAMANDDSPPQGPPQLVLSPSQRHQNQWRRGFWGLQLRRVINDEITIDPKDLAYGLSRFVPPDRPRGRPPGSRAKTFARFDDADSFLAHVFNAIKELYQLNAPLSAEIVAESLRITKRTLLRTLKKDPLKLTWTEAVAAALSDKKF